MGFFDSQLNVFHVFLNFWKSSFKLTSVAEANPRCMRQKRTLEQAPLRLSTLVQRASQAAPSLFRALLPISFRKCMLDPVSSGGSKLILDTAS